MKKEKNSKKKKPDDEMLPEYDFSGGVRGKHHASYQKGHSVAIRRADDTVEVSYYQLEDGAVMLEPDVKKYFPSSESVNATLRGLITLLPKRSGKVRAR